MRDEVYRQPQSQIVDFVFDEKVAQVFPDMIRRSIPGYETVIPLTGLLAAQHLQSAASNRPPRLYDLGCSLGASSAATLRRLGDFQCEIIGLDNAPDMLALARKNLDDPRLRWIEANVLEFDFQPADVVICNWIMQFLAPSSRVGLLRKLKAALNPGGLLILSEKLAYSDAAEQQWFDARHLDYKRANGYSELEISQKRTALEQVMRIDTAMEQQARLKDAGFSQIRPWFQCLNWASLLAYP